MDGMELLVVICINLFVSIISDLVNVICDGIKLIYKPITCRIHNSNKSMIVHDLTI